MIERLDLMDLWPVIPKKVKRFPVFLAISSQLHLCRAHQRSLHLKSEAISLKRILENYIKIGPKSFLGGHQKTTACLKQVNKVL